MRFGKLTFGLAALALVAAPAVAQASLTPAVAPLSGDENGVGDSGSIVLGLLGAAVVIGGIIVASDSDDTVVPVSP